MAGIGKGLQAAAFEIAEQIEPRERRKVAYPKAGEEDSAPLGAPRIVRDQTTGRFLKGTRSPGRTPGTVSAATKARALLVNHAEELVQIALEKVRTEGSSALLSDLLRFAMPQQRSQLQAVEIPRAADAMARGDFDGALAAVTEAVLSGEISADTGKVSTEQIRNAEEAKRLKRVEDEIHRLSEKVVNGIARRVA